MQRSLSSIAFDIKKTWRNKDGFPNVYFGAVPYLQAMESLDKITDSYYADSAKMIVLYFLANAQTWRGEHAKRIKGELKEILKTG